MGLPRLRREDSRTGVCCGALFRAPARGRLGFGALRLLEAGLCAGGGLVAPVRAPAVERVGDPAGSGSGPAWGAFTHSPDVTRGADDVSVFRSVL